MRVPITFSVTASGSDQGGFGCRALTSERRACSVSGFRIDMDFLLSGLRTNVRHPASDALPGALALNAALARQNQGDYHQLMVHAAAPCRRRGPAVWTMREGNVVMGCA